MESLRTIRIGSGSSWRSAACACRSRTTPTRPAIGRLRAPSEKPYGPVLVRREYGVQRHRASEVGDADPHLHVDVQFHADVTARDLLASTFAHRDHLHVAGE